MNTIIKIGMVISILFLVGCSSEKEKIVRYGNDSIKSIEHIDENGKLTGEKKNFTYDGKLDSIEHYKNGKKDGEQIYYYTDYVDPDIKVISTKYWYRDGKKTGTLFLDRDGKPTKRLGYYKTHL